MPYINKKDEEKVSEIKKYLVELEPETLTNKTLKDLHHIKGIVETQLKFSRVDETK